MKLGRTGGRKEGRKFEGMNEGGRTKDRKNGGGEIKGKISIFIVAGLGKNQFLKQCLFSYLLPS